MLVGVANWAWSVMELLVDVVGRANLVIGGYDAVVGHGWLVGVVRRSYWSLVGVVGRSYCW